MKNHPLRNLLTAIALTTGASITLADTVTVAVAANFAGAIKRLAPVFEEKTGHQLVASFGSSGQLYAQISNGAPFDVFLSADDSTPQKLVASGDAVKDSYFIYARGRLALWSATPGYVDNEGAILNTSTFNRLAIANPKTAPYGQAAVEVLTNLELLKQVQSLLVQGESIAQTHQFIASGNVPLGFIALSQVMGLAPSERGSYWLIPAELHKPIDQAAVVLQKAKSPAPSQGFLDFLRSPETSVVIRQMGYDTPAASQ